MNFIMEDQGRAVKLARYLLDEALKNLHRGGGADILSEDAG